jgi:antitoxin component of MazEF toxin-antitoxin module
MNNSFIVKLIEDENGDLILPIPEELSDSLGWEIGDTINFELSGNSVIITNLSANSRKETLTVDK